MKWFLFIIMLLPITSQGQEHPLEKIKTEESETGKILREREEFEAQEKKFAEYGTYVILLIVVMFAGFCIWAWKYKKEYVRKNTINGIYIGAGSHYFRNKYEKDRELTVGGNEKDFHSDWETGDDYSGGSASDSW